MQVLLEACCMPQSNLDHNFHLVGALSGHMSKPRKEHQTAKNGIFKSLCSTSYYVVSNQERPKSNIVDAHGFVAWDQVGDIDHRIFIIGYVFNLFGGIEHDYPHGKKVEQIEIQNKKEMPHQTYWPLPRREYSLLESQLTRMIHFLRKEQVKGHNPLQMRKLRRDWQKLIQAKELWKHGL